MAKDLHAELLAKTIRLPSDYSDYGGTVVRWADDNEHYPDCSVGCRWNAPLEGKLGSDWGVCTKVGAPRFGLLTFEHQAGFGCFESVERPQLSGVAGQTWKIREDDSFIAYEIERHLLTALRKEVPQAETNEGFVLTIDNAKGELVAGLAANTSYSWLLIKMLWVHEAHRGHGMASALMDAAEAKGRTLGCHAAWLDTSSPKARRFYEKRGYVEFGELTNTADQNPLGHKRSFVKKILGVAP